MSTSTGSTRSSKSTPPIWCRPWSGSLLAGDSRQIEVSYDVDHI